MKTLIALSLLVASTAFGQTIGDKIKCYDRHQENHLKKAFVFQVIENNQLVILYPDNLANTPLETHLTGCLGESAPGEEILFEACRSQMQEFENLVPVEVTGSEVVDRTVYCEQEILDWVH